MIGCIAWQNWQRCEENCSSVVSVVGETPGAPEKIAARTSEENAFMLPSMEVDGGKHGQLAAGASLPLVLASILRGDTQSVPCLQFLQEQFVQCGLSAAAQ